MRQQHSSGAAVTSFLFQRGLRMRFSLGKRVATALKSDDLRERCISEVSGKTSMAPPLKKASTFMSPGRGGELWVVLNCCN